MGVILGVDGGNSKTELVAASTDGEVLAHVRGPGSNSHGIGAEGVGVVIAGLVAEAGVACPVGHGIFFLCGADGPEDIAALESMVADRGWARESRVDNDTFALLRAGTERADAIAVICGAGINVVGRASGGHVARYPSLGWETGDWGGSEMLGREAVYLASRAADGRGQPTALVDAICGHFGAASVQALGADFHYRRLPHSRVGEIAPLVVAAATAGDRVARGLVERLALEIALLVRRALADLDTCEADVVLGGGMLAPATGLLYELVLECLPDGVTAIPLTAPPVLGAVLAALDAAGAGEDAKARLRGALGGG